MKNTEQKLKQLFDFQKFNKNAKLERFIQEAEAEGVKLSDEELEQVFAAGEPGALGTTGAGVEFKPVQ